MADRGGPIQYTAVVSSLSVGEDNRHFMYRSTFGVALHFNGIYNNNSILILR